MRQIAPYVSLMLFMYPCTIIVKSKAQPLTTTRSTFGLSASSSAELTIGTGMLVMRYPKSCVVYISTKIKEPSIQTAIAIRIRILFDSLNPPEYLCI